MWWWLRGLGVWDCEDDRMSVDGPRIVDFHLSCLLLIALAHEMRIRCC